MLEKNIETFIACDCEYEDSDIVLFGAPFDSTTSFRPGTRFASHAIRSESYGLETYSPYQDKDLADCKVFDSGDIELCMGSSEIALEQISDRAARILLDDKLPIMIGGEHLVTLGMFREVYKKHPDVQIIHFDAHADLRQEYLGAELSHACVIKRCHDLVGDGRIHQFGIRSGDRSEFVWSSNGHTDMHRFGFEGLEETVRALGSTPVYFTIDLDILDPSVFPGTGTPEAGGVGFMELLNAIMTVCGSANVVACDVNELSPHYDQSGASTAVACKVVRELILALQK
ncbi:MAG TPA: agmatinase [Candidatus Faeciplasma pullistercoris]|uniref:Agmatinase n=1 Tax=Candidatus Faeciplasma pullistercoris TaxID=2840800 RepID=A0A9D1KK10_9FIRM|nr:agmatinase [Candidatus Faeciplasma pullistercoris]